MGIKGVVVEVTCETCNGSGVVKGAFIPHIACQHCEGGVNRRCMTFSELKAVLALPDPDRAIRFADEEIGEHTSPTRTEPGP